MGAMLCCCRGGNMEKAMADAAAAAATGGNPRTNWMAWSSSPWGQRQCEAALTVLVVAVNGWNAGGGDMLDVLGLETKKVEYVDPEQARLAHIADISGHESNIPRVRAVASVSLSLVGGGGGGAG